MEEATENSKELSHSAHGNGMNECMCIIRVIRFFLCFVVLNFPDDGIAKVETCRRNIINDKRYLL